MSAPPDMRRTDKLMSEERTLETLANGYCGRVATIGTDVIACVHCETGVLVERARRELARTKPTGTLADWDALLSVNLTGALLGIQTVVPLMSGGGSPGRRPDEGVPDRVHKRGI